MVTVLDPLGSPSIFYNRSGRAIMSASATGTGGLDGTNGSDAVQLVFPTGHTTVLIATSAGNTGVRFPAYSDSDIGDVVDLVNTDQSISMRIYDNDNNFLFHTVQPVTLLKTAGNMWTGISNT